MKTINAVITKQHPTNKDYFIIGGYSFGPDHCEELIAELENHVKECEKIVRMYGDEFQVGPGPRPEVCVMIEGNYLDRENTLKLINRLQKLAE